MTFRLSCVHIIFSSVWVAEWPSFGKELLTRLPICSLCNFDYFPFWFRMLDLGSDCILQFLIFAYFFTFLISLSY